MQFEPPLHQASLIKRYKRFLADITTTDNEVHTIHCPNTGAMTGCAEPGYEVWYSSSDNPKRKYPHTWELARTFDNHWIVINTQRANTIAAEAIEQKLLPDLAGYQTLKREVRYGVENSRIDIYLSEHSDASVANCFIEVKSVTLADGDCGYFPDAVTTRGQKHLRELIEVAASGQRAMLLFVAGHSAMQEVRPAVHIDPTYAALCIEAAKSGVELRAIRCSINAKGIQPVGELPVVINF